MLGQPSPSPSQGEGRGGGRALVRKAQIESARAHFLSPGPTLPLPLPDREGGMLGLPSPFQGEGGGTLLHSSPDQFRNVHHLHP